MSFRPSRYRKYKPKLHSIPLAILLVARLVILFNKKKEALFHYKSLLIELTPWIEWPTVLCFKGQSFIL